MANFDTFLYTYIYLPIYKSVCTTLQGPKVTQAMVQHNRNIISILPTVATALPNASASTVPIGTLPIPPERVTHAPHLQH